jgi:hypothetical protein
MSGAQAMATVQNRLAAALETGGMPRGAGARGAQLLARLKAPVSVVVMGPPGSGKTSLVNLLIGRPVVPEGIDLPVTEIVSGPVPRTVFTLSDGTIRAVDGIAAPETMAEDAILVRLELPVPVLDSLSLTEIRVAGSHAEQRAAVDWAVRRADIVLWCSQGFGPGERDLWSAVPETLKDHSFLVLTMADQLQMKGLLQDRIAILSDVVAEEFHSLMPLATLHALAARNAQSRENPALWAASGGSALMRALLRQVQTGRAADADSALVFLSRYASGDLPVPAAAVTAPVASAEAVPAPAGRRGDGFIGSAIEFLAARSGELVRGLPEDDADRRAFVLDHCLSTATELGGLLMQADPGDPAAADLQEDMAEGLDMLLLLQLEKTDAAAADAVTLMLQLGKELAEHADIGLLTGGWMEGADR